MTLLYTLTQHCKSTIPQYKIKIKLIKIKKIIIDFFKKGNQAETYT